MALTLEEKLKQVRWEITFHQGEVDRHQTSVEQAQAFEKVLLQQQAEARKPDCLCASGIENFDGINHDLRCPEHTESADVRHEPWCASVPRPFDHVLPGKRVGLPCDCQNI